jgi:glycosyltransferase involved in cell wall biosynthesis
MPAVSIVIPVYNGERFLRRSIDSIRGQTFPDWELLIVDDGSTDGSAELIAEYARLDSRIRYFLEPHSGGPARPTNAGIRQASGKFLAFLDHDDEWLPGKLEKQLRALEARPDAAVSVCDLRVVTEGVASDFRFEPRLNRRFGVDEMFSAPFFFTFSILVLRKETLDRLGLLDEKLQRAADQDLYLRLALDARFVFVNEILVNFDGHVDSASTLKTAANYQRLTEEAVYLYEKYRPVLRGHRKALSGLALRAAKRYRLQEDRRNTRKYLAECLRLNPFQAGMYPGYLSLLLSGRG